jgi:DNA modification methylase
MTNLPPRVRRRSRSNISTDAPTSPAPCTPLQNDDRRIALSYVPIDAISPPKRALKKHSQRGLTALRASLRTHGIIRPILVDSDLNIVAGHGVWLAAEKLGFTEIPVVRVEHLTEAQLSAYAIADNQIANTNPFSDDALREALGELNSLNLAGALDFSIEVTGFTTSEIDNLLDVTVEAPWDTTPKPEEHAITRLGDVWQLGDHRLICADALQAESYVTLLGDERAELVVSDPPYGVKINGHVSGLGKTRHREFVMGGADLEGSKLTDFLITAFTHLAHFSVDGSIHFVFMDWRHMREMLDAGNAAYTELKNLIVWNKAPFCGMGSFYRSQHELLFVWKRGKARHRNNFGLGETGRSRSNVWNHTPPSNFERSRDEFLSSHPTIKPTSLIADAIRDCSGRGGIILDPFGGSGTALIAAEKTGRRARLIELDPLYCDVIVRRWQKLAKRAVLHAATGETFEEREAAVLADAPEGEVDHD